MHRKFKTTYIQNGKRKLRGHSVGAAGAGSCVGSLYTALYTASHMAFRRVALSTRQLPGGLKSCRTCGVRLVKASFSPLLYSILPINDSAHEEDAIALPFWILEMQKCHHKLLSVCNGFF